MLCAGGKGPREGLGTLKTHHTRPLSRPVPSHPDRQRALTLRGLFTIGSAASRAFLEANAGHVRLIKYLLPQSVF